MRRYLLLVLISTLFYQCEKSIFNTNQRVIVLQPYDQFSSKELIELESNLKKINPNVVTRSSVSFSEKAFVKSRNRYRADSLIKYQQDWIGKDSIIVGITSKDISVTKNGIQDWGVMGLGYRPGNSCIVSTFRLNKHYKKNQFYKVVLHEIGHTEGLKHCDDKKCLMRDAEGKNVLQQVDDYCDNCKKQLRKNNWKI